jgi:hypothetical protein
MGCWGNCEALRWANGFWELRLTTSRIGSIVPLGRAIFLLVPGTSCLATIVLSLRDKDDPAHRSGPHYLSARGLQPWGDAVPRVEGSFYQQIL